MIISKPVSTANAMKELIGSLEPAGRADKPVARKRCHRLGNGRCHQKIEPGRYGGRSMPLPAQAHTVVGAAADKINIDAVSLDLYFPQT